MCGQKRLVIGDIHGRYGALKEVLRKCQFDYDKDKLIILGDVVDGGKDTKKVIDELLKIKNLVYIYGNHDHDFFMRFLDTGWHGNIWLYQGGIETLQSYRMKVKKSKHMTIPSEVDIDTGNIPESHKEFFKNGVYYHIEDDMLFVHGGINPRIPKIESQSEKDLLWDRNLIYWCQRGNSVPGYKKVFVGHTSTENIDGTTDPLKFGNLWCLDTDAGWSGKLTIMDIDSEDYWQSRVQRCPVNRKNIYTPAHSMRIKS